MMSPVAFSMLTTTMLLKMSPLMPRFYATYPRIQIMMSCSDIFDTHVTDTEHQIVEYHECDESARTDNDVNSDIFDDSVDVFISV